jgi:hypothetical protein
MTEDRGRKIDWGKPRVKSWQLEEGIKAIYITGTYVCPKNKNPPRFAPRRVVY